MHKHRGHASSGMEYPTHRRPAFALPLGRSTFQCMNGAGFKPLRSDFNPAAAGGLQRGVAQVDSYRPRGGQPRRPGPVRAASRGAAEAPPAGSSAHLGGGGGGHQGLRPSAHQVGRNGIPARKSRAWGAGDACAAMCAGAGSANMSAAQLCCTSASFLQAMSLPLRTMPGALPIPPAAPPPRRGCLRA